SSEFARTQWRRCGVDTALLPGLDDLSARLYEAFTSADATLLEVNPIAVDAHGNLSAVGAMMAIDEHALFRHPQWAIPEDDENLPENPRERRVALVSRE